MEVKQRVANIFRFISMISVIGSLLYMYAYGADTHSIMPLDEGWFSTVPKETVFYVGLGIFGVFNLLLNWGIKMYKETKGFDSRSFLFRSEDQKAKIVLWLTLLLAAINFFISSIVAYIAFIKINGESVERQYLYFPLMGLAFLIVAVSGLVIACFNRHKA